MTDMRTVVSFIVAICLAGAVQAETAQQKGERIARAADLADDGYGDFSVQGEMVLKTARGAQSKRRFTTKTLEEKRNSVQKSILEFEWPGDIRDTALLTHSFAGRQDAQWLYLPSVGRVKKISGAGRSGSFVGSEFAFEDMVEQDARNYRHTWLGDERCPTGQGTCHKLTREPRHKSGYSKQVVWIDTKGLRYQTVQFFNRRGQHLKTLSFLGYRQFKGRIWRPTRMVMVNHLTGKSTTLNWSNFRFDVGLSPREFTQNALTR